MPGPEWGQAVSPAGQGRTGRDVPLSQLLRHWPGTSSQPSWLGHRRLVGRGRGGAPQWLQRPRSWSHRAAPPEGSPRSPSQAGQGQRLQGLPAAPRRLSTLLGLRRIRQWEARPRPLGTNVPQSAGHTPRTHGAQARTRAHTHAHNFCLVLQRFWVLFPAEGPGSCSRSPGRGRGTVFADAAFSPKASVTDGFTPFQRKHPLLLSPRWRRPG